MVQRIALLSAVALLALRPAPGFANAGPRGERARAARAAVTTDDTHEAGRDLKLALQENPLDARAHYLLGCVLAREGEEDQAVVGFHRALTLDPTHPGALYNLGTLLLRRGEAVPAAEMLERSVSLRPDHAPSYNCLAKAYFVAGLPDLASDTYAEALRVDPENTVARRNLALLTEAAGADLVLAADGLVTVPNTTPQAEVKAQEHLKKIEALESGLADGKPEAKEDDAPPPAGEKEKKDTPPPAAGEQGKKTASPPDGDDADSLRELLRDLPHVAVERRGGHVVLTGWTSSPGNRAILDRIIAATPGVLDLTSDDLGNPQRMIEIDAVLFIMSGNDRQSIGFNFLRAVDLNFKYTQSDQTTTRDVSGRSVLSGLSLDNPASTILKQAGAGAEGSPTWETKYDSRGDVYDLAANTLGTSLSQLSQEGWVFGAAVDYVVNIANAEDERVSVLARPHLTTLSGTPASFLAGGEIVFRVQGIESGDIKPYPFGTSVTVTPTVLRTLSENGSPRIHIAVEASRSSVLEFLTAISDDDSVIFDRLLVTSEAVLDLDQTLILSGLNQRETRSGRAGVPILRATPILKYFFSTKTTFESNTAVLILLTPRDPAFMDQQNRLALAQFVRKRQAFVQAQQGTPEDMQRFREDYPDWDQLPPNRYASHFFLAKNTELYRRISGEDLLDEDLDLDLMGEVLEEEASVE